MATEYRVTITKIETDVPYKDKAWKQTKPSTEENTGFEYVYSDGVRDVSTQIFDQTVDELNMQAVVGVINGLAPFEVTSGDSPVVAFPKNPKAGQDNGESPRQ